MNEIGERISQLQKGATQREFAQRLGVPLNTYTAWLRGERLPSFDAIIRICTQCGVSADWLLGLAATQTGASASADASARYGSAVATNRSTATVAPSADTGRLVEIIAAQQRTIDRLAASITGDRK